MYEVIIENAKGEQLNLTNDEELMLCTIDGIYGYTNTINNHTLANYDGAIHDSSYTNVRQIVMEFALYGKPEEQRIKLYRYFNRKGAVKFYYQSDLRKVYINGHVEDITINVHTNPVEAVVTILCEDPLFKATTGEIVYYSERIPLLKFPFSTNIKEPVEFSRLEILNEQNLYNEGSAPTGLIVTFKALGGKVTNPVIENANTAEKMGLTGYEMQNGEVITIDTRKGYKTITSNINGDLLAYIIDDFKWLNVNVGDNIFRKGATNGDANLTVRFNFEKCYDGV